jgi:glucosamine--fructose-6-phosphate aminotransferase (isomerizing)
MCGIVGYVGTRDALPLIISGLEKLEYRGYDSAGVAMLEDGRINVTRALGKLGELKKVLAARTNGHESHLGIGHTRWATHGRPSENNAHPHTAGRVSLVHNGIIENYVELREELEREGAAFKSETDTEIAAHLVNKYLASGLEPLAAIKAACGRIKGSYAFVAIDAKHPDRILVAKNSSPLIVGLGEGETFVASDIPAVLGSTRKVVILEDGDIAEIKGAELTIEHAGVEIHRDPITITWDPVTAQKGGYKHFMLKEIHEQSRVITDTFRGRIEPDAGRVALPEIHLSDAEIAGVKRVVLLACGTAWHACLIAKFYLERYAKLPCEVDYASEFRYREPVLDGGTLVIAVSQSGETADTLAAIEMASNQARALYPRRSGDQRRIDQGLYHAAHRRVSFGRLPRPASRRSFRGRGARTARRFDQGSGRDRRGVRGRGTGPRSRQGIPPCAGFPLLGPRRVLPNRARRRAQDEGDFVHPRRGISGGRNEARPHRAHR